MQFWEFLQANFFHDLYVLLWKVANVSKPESVLNMYDNLFITSGKWDS